MVRWTANIQLQGERANWGQRKIKNTRISCACDDRCVTNTQKYGHVGPADNFLTATQVTSHIPFELTAFFVIAHIPFYEWMHLKKLEGVRNFYRQACL